MNSFVLREIILPHIKVPVVAQKLNLSDILGGWKARWNMGRMSYYIKDGLYAIGNPDKSSPVLVTANYKMSLDYLRRELVNISAWILILDTKGINVWCAAGKGTFGTEELIKQIKNTKMEDIIEHKELILPQLGAVGVEAHKVKKATGFRVIYGPVRARDLPAFLKNNKKADPEMRQVRFPFYDRLVLLPVEFVLGARPMTLILALFFIASGLSPEGFSSKLATSEGLPIVILIFLSYISGAVITPLLLPFIPGRAFAFKGLLTGILMALLGTQIFSQLSTLETASSFLVLSAVSSYLAMNFTGTTTFTSLSGVLKEMKIAIPLQIGALLLGSILWIVTRFIG